MVVGFHQFHRSYNLRARQLGIFPRIGRTSVVLEISAGKEVKIAIRDFHDTTVDILRRTIVAGLNILAVFVGISEREGNVF